MTYYTAARFKTKFVNGKHIVTKFKPLCLVWDERPTDVEVVNICTLEVPDLPKGWQLMIATPENLDILQDGAQGLTFEAYMGVKFVALAHISKRFGVSTLVINHGDHWTKKELPRDF